MIERKEVEKLRVRSKFDYFAVSVICSGLPAFVIKCGNDGSESRREHLGYVRRGIYKCATALEKREFLCSKVYTPYFVP
jgi:hypothetical protein